MAEADLLSDGMVTIKPVQIEALIEALRGSAGPLRVYEAAPGWINVDSWTDQTTITIDPKGRGRGDG